MAKQFLVNIDLGNNQIVNVVVHSGGLGTRNGLTPSVGQLFFNTDSGEMEYYTDATSPNSWVSMAPGAVSTSLGSLTDVTLSAPETGSVLYKSGTDWIDKVLEANDIIYDVTESPDRTVFQVINNLETNNTGTNTGDQAVYNTITGDTGSATAATGSNTLNLTGASFIQTTVTDGAPDSVSIGVNTGTFNSAVRGLFSIEAGSTSFLTYNSANGEFGATQLLITDVTVDNTETSLANYVTNVYAAASPLPHQEGDVIVLTNVDDGNSPANFITESYIHNGGVAGTAADFTKLSNPADTAAILALFTGGDGIDYNSGTGNIAVDLATNSGLEFATGQLQINRDTETGATVAPVSVTANGVGVAVDNTTITHTTGTISVGTITSSNVSDFNEAAQDAVGTILTDGTTIDFTYTDSPASISAIVNSSATANQVLLSAGTVNTEATWGALPLGNANAVTGVLGGNNGGTGFDSGTLADGDLLYIGGSPNDWLALNVGTNGQVLTVSGGLPTWQNPTGGVSKFATTATVTSAGTTVNHALGTTDVIVQVYDLAGSPLIANDQVQLDISVTDSNNIVVRKNGANQDLRVVVMG
jgi:hypothetical protein